MNKDLNISIVIPTSGRISLVERLLSSLVNERKDYPYGKTEVIVVNSGEKESTDKIKQLCEKYNADFYQYENSVRKKRNLGIKTAKYEVILFLDSDVAAEKGLLKYHAQTYLDSQEKKLGGVFGLTEFVGKKTRWWRVIEQTTYLDSFSFSKHFQYNDWTIGNNVSFYRKVLLEVGMFEENLPFPLGGDDLDLTYRITKTGYLIKSCPQAVTLHSTETWNNFKAIYNRTYRWGSMEYYISKRHPEIFVNCIPKSGVMFICTFIICSIFAMIMNSTIPIAFAGLWLVLHYLCVYIYDCFHKDGGNPFYYLLGKAIRVLYRFYYEYESIKNRDFSCFHKEMSFSLNQTKYMQKRETAVFKIYSTIFVVLLVGFYLKSILL